MEPMQITVDSSTMIEAYKRSQEIIIDLDPCEDLETAEKYMNLARLAYEEVKLANKSKDKIAIPLKEAKAELLNQWHTVVDPLNEFIKAAKREVKAFQDRERAKEAEEERKLQEKREREAMKIEKRIEAAKKPETKERLAETAETIRTIIPIIKKTKVITTKKKWRVRITNFAALEDKYKLPNIKMLEKMAAAEEDGFNHPGVEAYKEDIPSL